MSNFVVHAAKIPEGIQERSKRTRLAAGDGYVNACDDMPWSSVPEGMPFSEGVACAACQYIVEQNRRVKAGDLPRPVD